MIEEITNFQESIISNPLKDNFQPDDGLYIFLSIDIDGNKAIDIESLLYEGEDDLSFFKKEYRDFLGHSYPIHFRKTFNSGKVKIFNKICSPFGIGFKKEFIESNSSETIDEGFRIYFENAIEYCDQENSTQLKYAHQFENFVKNNLLSFVRELKEYEDLKVPIFVFYKDVPVRFYKEAHDKYLSEKVFNKEQYNKELDNQVFGIVDNLSTFQPKKTFLRHQTAPFEFNFRIRGNQALKISEFYKLLDEKLLPNPVPIFIDERELNEKVVSVFNEDKRLGYAEIITKLITDHKKDLGNYYLIFYRKSRKGVYIIDLDFVPSFKFKVDPPLKVKEPFQLGGKVKTTVSNVFDLQNKVLNKVFNGQLVQKDGRWLKYFDDVDFNPNYFTSNGYNLFLKYRKAFYDYIYKSKQQAITKRIFDEIMVNGILDDIRLDKYQSRKTNSIKEKLNIWFSLYNFFDITANKNEINMPNKTQELLEKCKKMIAKDTESESIANDDEFAFVAGQIIYFLFSKSESSNLTHAALEPFLQKKNPELFKQGIIETFNIYKHRINLKDKKFNKLMGEVVGFEPEDQDVKKLLPFILAGYFSDSIFYQKQ